MSVCLKNTAKNKTGEDSLVERAGEGVGQKRPVRHCVDVLYQVMKKVPVRTTNKKNMKKVIVEVSVQTMFC